MLMGELERDVLSIQEEAIAAKHRIEERKIDHEVAMARKRRELAALPATKQRTRSFAKSARRPV